MREASARRRAKLPGTPARVHVPRDPDDWPSGRSTETVRALILQAIARVPLAKWQIREAIHEPEIRIGNLLKILRKEGRVKLIGSGANNWRWGLPDAIVPDPRVAGNVMTHHIEPKPKPGSTRSWWADHARADVPRESFVHAAAARDQELRSDKRWQNQRRETLPVES